MRSGHSRGSRRRAIFRLADGELTREWTGDGCTIASRVASNSAAAGLRSRRRTMASWRVSWPLWRLFSVGGWRIGAGIDGGPLHGREQRPFELRRGGAEVAVAAAGDGEVAGGRGRVAGA